MTTQKKIAIVGAGLTGLTAALDLCAVGHQVTLFEREREIGGLCRVVPTCRGKDFVERFYHHLFTSDIDAISLFEELGIASHLDWIPPRNAFYRHGLSHPFSGPIDLLTFKPLAPLRRLLMGLHILSTRLIRNWNALERETAASWVRRHTGKAVFDTVWGPLLSSKFGDESEHISAVWLANKLKLRGSSRKSGAGGECLGYPRGGFGVLIDSLVQRLSASRTTFHFSEPVERILLNPRSPQSKRESASDSTGTFLVQTSLRTELFDEILCTISPGSCADLMPEQPAETLTSWRSIRYQANLCLLLELDRSLSPFYWTSVADRGFPFVAVIEHTNLLPVSRYDSHLVYVSRYLNPQDPLFSAPDDEVTRVFQEGLGRLLPEFRNAVVRSHRLSRASHAQPVVTPGYSSRIPPLQTMIPGIWLASMAQIFPEDRGVNYAIRLGRNAAKAILSSSRENPDGNAL
ncbi:MAG: NAD(P)/FAD-dependent oxidoreductase [Candidatus Ozemobacteraceae bacterium]